MTTAGDFLDLNAQQRLQRQHPNVHKLRPGVVRRVTPAPEPDREFVDKSGQTMSEPEPDGGAEPVAAKKKRTRSPESIAKMKATLAAKKAAGQVGKKAKKKAARRPIPALPATPRDAPVAVLGHEALEAVQAWLDPIVRNVVREEIRRMLS